MTTGPAAPQKPRTIGTTSRRRYRCRTRDCPTASRSTPRRSPTPILIRSPRRPSTPTTTARRTNGQGPRFTQNVGYDADGKLAEPIKYASLYDKNEDGEVTARAELWGIEGDDPSEPITMTRYYAAQRTFWVDPVTGTIVKSTERLNQYYARDPLKPEAAVVDYKVTSTEETVESQVAAARAERDRLALWSRIPPIGLGSAGLVILVGGALLGLFSARIESALPEENEDDIDIGLFGGMRRDRCRLRRRPPRKSPPADRSHRRRSGDTGDHSAPAAPFPATRLALTGAVTAPLLAPGYLLIRDAVSTPRSLSVRQCPRPGAKPPHARFPGLRRRDALGRRGRRTGRQALLIAALWVAGWGRPTVGPAVPKPASPGSSLQSRWRCGIPLSPNVFCRGHWSLLLGYGSLPWVAAAVIRLRTDGRPAHWAAVVFWIAVAGLTRRG